MSQTCSKNVMRSLRPFFPLVHRNIPGLPQNILWNYMAKYDAPTLPVLDPIMLSKEISPTCLYFCFAPWSRHSTREADSSVVKPGLKK